MPTQILVPRWALSLGILVAPAFLLFNFFPDLLTPAAAGIYLGIILVLLLIAHYVEFMPDMGDLSWFGGMMDDPYSLKDDFHRGWFSGRSFSHLSNTSSKPSR